MRAHTCTSRCSAVLGLGVELINYNLKMFSSLRKKLSGSNVIKGLEVKDIRFPTSLGLHGSDAIHKDPDYSAAYVILSVEGVSEQGHGLTFTLGRGTEVVVKAVTALSSLVVGQNLLQVFTDFGGFWHKLTNESQLRWIGPEKGVVHLATAAVINALWDLWGKIESKPVWKLLCDMTPEETVSLIDFTHLTDEFTKEEALAMLSRQLPSRSLREADVLKEGYPLYITSIGWLGYSKEQVSQLCKKALGEGFKRFKMKVGVDLEEDVSRAALIRAEVGWDVPLMMDANQVWDVDVAVHHMTRLAEFKPLWIEEPTSPDDILGHAKIGRALKKFDIGIATGEMCHNKVMFKQFLAAEAMDYCQIDAARLGGVNEILAVILMAAKFGVPVCPHAGGVGLCEYVIHLSLFDYVCVSGSKEGRMTEYAEHLHEHFVEPPRVRAGEYWPPQRPGYSQMKGDTLDQFSYPDGQVWKTLTK